MISMANGALIARPLIMSEFVGLNAVQSQSVRWRKPIWLGTAKSKIFRVPKRPVIPLEEMNEIKRLNCNYRTYRESIKKHLLKATAESMVQFDETVVRKAQEKDFIQCSTLNDAWNKEIAKSREAREKMALDALKESVLVKLVEKEKRDKLLMKKIDSEIRQAKSVAPTFITEKNIDQAIEEALSNIVDHNYAIDTEGNKYDNTYVPPALVNQEKAQAEQ